MTVQRREGGRTGDLGIYYEHWNENVPGKLDEGKNWAPSPKKVWKTNASEPGKPATTEIFIRYEIERWLIQ